MPVYVDKLRDWGWRLGPSCHLISDSNEELHVFAKKLGLKRAWFQKSTSGPHYDLTASKRALAVKLGAEEITDRKMVALIRAAQTEEENQGTPVSLGASIMTQQEKEELMAILKERHAAGNLLERDVLAHAALLISNGWPVREAVEESERTLDEAEVEGGF